jgi:hypothetical protein
MTARRRGNVEVVALTVEETRALLAAAASTRFDTRRSASRWTATAT